MRINLTLLSSGLISLGSIQIRIAFTVIAINPLYIVDEYYKALPQNFHSGIFLSINDFFHKKFLA